VGFISQEKIPDYLTLTPGIHLSVKTDNKGQTYKNFDQVDSDIYIVGRGIYESNNILKTIIQYKMASYCHWKY
jgi:orotidine-5'-phosphate decarboxylase